MEYLEQTHKDIRLYLVEGDSAISQFRILETDKFVWRDVEINFGILGASHYINFNTTSETLTEICACVPGKFSAYTQMLIDSHLDNLSQPMSHSISDYVYTFAHNIYTTLEGAELKNELLDYKIGDHLLSREFPSVQTSVTPLTIIKVIEHTKKVITKTVHTYPNEDIMVFTESSLVAL